MKHLPMAALAAAGLLTCPFPAGLPQAQLASRGLGKPDATVEASLPQGWQSGVSERIRRSEYQFTSLDEELWSAPSRSQELRSRVDRRGIEIFPREIRASGEGAAWSLRVGTNGFGRVGDLSPVETRAVSVEGERIELDHGALVEWFVNDERGIEQGWTIAERVGSRNRIVA